MGLKERQRRSEEEEESVCIREVGGRESVLCEREKEIERRKESEGNHEKGGSLLGGGK